MLYILDDENNPVEVNAISRWESWMQTNTQRIHIAESTIGDYKISTIFKGVDGNAHTHTGPFLFESTVLDDFDDIMEVKVYSSYSDALQNHQKLMEEYEFAEN